MRIAVVHSFYSESKPSGENRVVEDQVSVLQKAGHEVTLIRQDTDQLASRLYPIKTGISLAVGGGANPVDWLVPFAPDIVHIHNLFPNFSSGWTMSWKGPLVASVHNYRSLCSNGLLFRNGQVCLDCATGSSWAAVAHGCYRDSRIATLPVAISRRRDQRNILQRADAVITTSVFSDQILRRFARVKIDTTVIPNFGHDDSTVSVSEIPSERWIALGRFSSEKGFVELVQEWPRQERLLLIGEGPLRGKIISAIKEKPIQLMGSLPRDVMRELMQDSLGIVVPSRWFEVDPQVVVEALSMGLPVVSRDGNAVADRVSRSGAGVVYKDSVSLTAALASVRKSRVSMSRQARAEYEATGTKQMWLKSIEQLYSRVVNKSVRK